MLSKFKRKLRHTPFHYSQILPPTQITYPPYEPNSEKIATFHERPEKIRAVFGGNRSGKTYSTAQEVLRILRQIPGGVGWAATVTYEGVGQYLWPTYEEHLADEEILEISWLRYSQRIPSVVRLRGYTLIFKSYEQGRRKFQGANVDVIHLDEEPEKDIYLECLARTVDRHGKIIFSMTPLMGKTWVYRDIYEAAAKSHNIWQTTVSLFDNKFIDDSEKQVMVDTYGSDEAARRIEGQFTALEGAVFKELRPELHFIDRFPIPIDWRIVRSLDLGYKNPFCALWGAFSPDDELFVYLEHYQAETLLEDHARAIHAIETDPVYYTNIRDPDMFDLIESCVCDHDRQERAELEQYGIDTQPADKDVKHSIELINRLLKPKGNGRPSLYVFNDLTNLLDELPNYRYKIIRNGYQDKEEPIKEHDHAIDALRYLVMYFFADAYEFQF